MARCEHCGTEFPARDATERYCCRGCEFVARLIAENGFERFYDLKQDLAVAPVRGRPFEEHDFSWLAEKTAVAEGRALERHEPASLELSLEGISCVGCVWLVERLFQRHGGAVRAIANPANGRLRLEWLPGACAVEDFLRELTRFGYVAAPAGAGGGGDAQRRLAARIGLCGAFMMNTLGFMLPVYLKMPADFMFAELFRLIAFLSATLSMLVGAGYFINRAWVALRAGSLHIDLPIALGLLAAYAGSIAGWASGRAELLYFDFVSTFVFLMLCGRYLQNAAAERNKRRLVRRQPVPASVVPAGEDSAAVERADIAPGLRFFLQPGQAMPVSGVMAEGEADFSLEWIHGEADAVKMAAGAGLPAGVILLSRSPALVEAAETWEDSLLARLTAADQVERGSPGLERVLRIYLALVLALGVVTLLLWWLAWGAPWQGLQAMISVFVVSCPCALGVAIPLADDLAAGAVQRLGVYVRSASLWPRLRRVRKVVFDKTGTLTLDRPELLNPDAIAGLEDEAALALARLTRGSLHPAARALLEALGFRGQSLLENAAAAEPVETPGLGVAVETPQGRWSLGRGGWDGRSQQAPPAAAAGSELRRDGKVIATFRFTEALRPGAENTVETMKKAGLGLHILSGDHPEKVARLAAALGIPARDALGGLSPDDKFRLVRKLNAGDLLYLGDGANDSLAFDAAFVTGTPVVDRSLLETKADFFTLGAGLGFLPALFQAAAARSTAARAAFVFAVVYNLVAVAFCVTGNMLPAVAAIIMPISSILSISIVAGLSGAINAKNFEDFS